MRHRRADRMRPAGVVGGVVKLRDFAWEYFGASIMLAILAVMFLLTMAGCGTTTNTRTQDNARIVGSVAGAPVDVQVQRQVQEHSDTTIKGPDLSSLAPLAPLVPGPIGAGLGLVGAAFGAWRMLREREANKAVEQTVKGVEAFKQQIAPETCELLSSHLGRAMDEKVKAKIKQARAKA